MWSGLSAKEEYRRRNHGREANYKKKLSEESAEKLRQELGIFRRSIVWLRELWDNKSDRVPILLVFFTAGLFVATVILAIATRDLVHDGEATAERQLRAYVVLDFAGIVDPLGTPKLTMKVKNYG
jgi:hypothetical protein